MSPGAGSRLKVVIADDHPFYRAGLARVLEQSGIDVVAAVPNGEAALSAVRRAAPDVVLMDLNMPGLSGVEATRRVTAVAPDTRVIVLTVSTEEGDVADAVLAGATGYLLKDAPAHELVESIRSVTGSCSLLSPRVAAMLLQRSRAHGPRLLTADERELLRLAAEGASDQQIAHALGTSRELLRQSLWSTLAKLQAASHVHASAAQRRRHGARWLQRGARPASARRNPDPEPGA
jgi:DNA-binding NarL/FixJ family response regulator